MFGDSLNEIMKVFLSGLTAISPGVVTSTVDTNTMNLVGSVLLVVMSVMMTNVGTLFVQSRLNKAIDAKTKEETANISLHNMSYALELKDREIEIYREKIDRLMGEVNTLCSKIEVLEVTVSSLKVENFRLAEVILKPTQ